MPTGKNCPNCGAPFDLGVDQCPFCGTIYFDLSCIDFTDSKPIFLKIKTRLPPDGRPVTVTQRVLPRLEEIKVQTNTVNYQRVGAKTIRRKMLPPTVLTNITFESVEMANGDVARMVFDNERM